MLLCIQETKNTQVGITEMTFKEIQVALKSKGIKKTIQEIGDFFAQHNLDVESTVLEDVVKLFEDVKQQSGLAKSESRGISTRAKRGLKRFEEQPQETPESTTHNKFHDINDETFQLAVQKVAETNVQKAVIFPQAVAQRTHELLSDPENQQVLQASINDASTAMEQMMYGFNPSAV